MQRAREVSEIKPKVNNKKYHRVDEIQTSSTLNNSIFQ